MSKLEKQKNTLPFIQLILFLAIIIIVQYKLFMLAFTVLAIFIIYSAITGKQKRVFLWMLAGYTIGYVIFLFGDRLIELLPFHINILMILSRMLLLIPIIIMMYIAYKFNEKMNFYWTKPNWQAKISFPFIWTGFHSISIKLFLIIAISINIISFFPFILQMSHQLSTFFILFLLLFSSINAILEEILWRGIILTRLVDLAGEKTALLISSFAFGLSHLILGYSFLTCMLFSIGGIFYAGMTIRSGSIYPAIIWHFIFNILMIASGLIPFIN
ncbi:membrane protease YdiL (CAAX protease family) [Cytobacillus eiseniae]|uniref:Membrane protease YdiL (CAAX protease family) n=1 Tax=Cytobacillus eiseniae TaxID=762947 RepID=A0ABS4RKG5_9BACI|nr:type II CAAX endopeptidase family protein [Cytobacillus eiseniae]MBP2242282.1 membrane protease YdiL (CAAX protease family) [Cytobacillus eiseniae]